MGVLMSSNAICPSRPNKKQVTDRLAHVEQIPVCQPTYAGHAKMKILTWNSFNNSLLIDHTIKNKTSLTQLIYIYH